MSGDMMTYFCPRCNSNFATLAEYDRAHGAMRSVHGNEDHIPYGPLTLPRYFAGMANALDNLQSSVDGIHAALSQRIEVLEQTIASYQGFIVTVPLSIKGVESTALENATCTLMLRGNTALFNLKLEGSYRTSDAPTFRVEVVYPLPEVLAAVTSVVWFDLNRDAGIHSRKRREECEKNGSTALEFTKENGKTVIYAVKDGSVHESWESGLAKCKISASGTLYFNEIPFTNTFDSVVIYMPEARRYLCYQNSQWCLAKDFTDPGCRLSITQKDGYCIIQNGANCLGYNKDEEEIKKYTAQNDKVKMKVVIVNPALGISEILSGDMYLSALNGKPYFGKDPKQCIIKEI